MWNDFVCFCFVYDFHFWKSVSSLFFLHNWWSRTLISLRRTPVFFFFQASGMKLHSFGPKKGKCIWARDVLVVGSTLGLLRACCVVYWSDIFPRAITCTVIILIASNIFVIRCRQCYSSDYAPKPLQVHFGQNRWGRGEEMAVHRPSETRVPGQMCHQWEHCCPKVIDYLSN